jgi:hypothetical protein
VNPSLPIIVYNTRFTWGSQAWRVPVDDLASILVTEYHEGTKPALFIVRAFHGARRSHACRYGVFRRGGRDLYYSTFLFEGTPYARCQVMYNIRFAWGSQAWRVPVDGLTSVLVTEYHEGTKPALYIRRNGYRKTYTIILLFFFICDARFAWSSSA